MRRRGKIDANQSDIVKALRQAGATVKSLADLGSGCGDLLVGWRGRNFFFEVKDPNQPPSKRKLTDDEKAFHYAWQGQISVIETVEEAFQVMGQ